MNSANISRIECLSKDNYDTWKIQMEALLIKNDAWVYVSGQTPIPVLKAGDPVSEKEFQNWMKNDSKARSDIILSICPSELKQIKGCGTSKEVWLKLESIYQSKGPARKATLLKQLTLQHMNEGENIREHVNRFFDAVDKLCEMGVEINPDLLSIMLLYSLPSSFENFRCAIESRDNLPSPDILRVKIIEESDARKNETRTSSQDALYIKKNFQIPKQSDSPGSSSDTRGSTNKNQEIKFRCFKCKKPGHKAAKCRAKSQKSDQNCSKYAENECLSATEVFQTGANEPSTRWCLDSGASAHLCKETDCFKTISYLNDEKLNLANNQSTEIVAQGSVSFIADVFGDSKVFTLSNALLVPDLRTNLLSVGKMTLNGYEVLFKKDKALLIGADGTVKLVADRIGDMGEVMSSVLGGLKP